MVDRPSGTVTFVFTDIEGSTRRWEADPEAMRTCACRKFGRAVWQGLSRNDPEPYLSHTIALSTSTSGRQASISAFWEGAITPGQRPRPNIGHPQVTHAPAPSAT